MTTAPAEIPTNRLRGPAALRTFYRPRAYGSHLPAVEPSVPTSRRHALAPLLAVALLLLAAGVASASRLPAPNSPAITSPVEASVSPSRGRPYTRFDAAVQTAPSATPHPPVRGPVRP